MSVLLFPNPTKDDGLMVTRRAAELLHDFGASLVVFEEYKSLFSGLGNIKFLPEEKCFEAADTVVTVGGDGTLLRAGVSCVRYNKPVLGINLGRVGFLATCEVREMSEKLKLLAGGQYTLERRSLLFAECPSLGWRQLAINDVTLFGVSRLHPMDYTVYCDGSFVSRYRSDGVIVSTPTGSTAYSLSAGGPVIDGGAPVMLFTPVCAHSLHAAPLVFAESRKIRIVSDEENRDGICLCADSQEPCTIKPGEYVDISNANERLNLITFDNAEPFRSIESKLTGR